MKYIIVLALLLSGCSQMDGIYGTGKDVYKAGKEVAPLVPMSEEVRTTLITVDEVATKYDTAREIVREEKTADVNTSSVKGE